MRPLLRARGILDFSVNFMDSLSNYYFEYVSSRTSEDEWGQLCITKDKPDLMHHTRLVHRMHSHNYATENTVH